MKYMKYVLAGIVAAVLLTTTALAATNAPVVKSGDLGAWTLSLSGGGASDLGGGTLNSSAVGGEFALGHTGELILPLEAGVRQGIWYSDAEGADWQFSTKVFSDWALVKLGSLQFDIGGNVGILYGDRKLTWVAAPEVVARLYLKEDVDLFGRVEYPFNLNEGRAEESLVYTLGIRVRF